MIAMTVLAVLMVLSYAGVNAVYSRARLAEEMGAGRGLIAAYLAKVDNDGDLLAGFDANATVEIGGETVGYPVAARYPWRLAEYGGLNPEGTFLLSSNRRGAGENEDLRYFVSVAPALGLNIYSLGGYHSGQSTRYAKDVARTILQVPDPSKMIVFASARTGAGSERTIGGNHYVSPPTGPFRWQGEKFDEDKAAQAFGNVDCRHQGKALAVFLDGHAETLKIDEMLDMRMWCKKAQDNGDPHYVMKAR